MKNNLTSENILDIGETLGGLEDIATFEKKVNITEGVLAEINAQMSPSPSKEAFKDYFISSFGNEFTNWRNIENISSKIIEIGEEQIIVECLIDKETLHYQRRSLNKSLFKYIEDLSPGKLILIRVYEYPPETKFRIEDGTGIINDSDFQITGLFKNIHKAKMFSTIPTNKIKKKK